MSQSFVVCSFLCVAVSALVGCATPKQQSGERASIAAHKTAAVPTWNKYYVAGSRIPRELDSSGQPLTGSSIVTITDDDLQRSSGILLGDKLAGGYPR